jgi:hypothetical protein
MAYTISEYAQLPFLLKPDEHKIRFLDVRDVHKPIVLQLGPVIVNDISSCGFTLKSVEYATHERCIHQFPTHVYTFPDMWNYEPKLTVPLHSECSVFDSNGELRPNWGEYQPQLYDIIYPVLMVHGISRKNHHVVYEMIQYKIETV